MVEFSVVFAIFSGLVLLFAFYQMFRIYTIRRVSERWIDLIYAVSIRDIKRGVIWEQRWDLLPDFEYMFYTWWKPVSSFVNEANLVAPAEEVAKSGELRFFNAE